MKIRIIKADSLSHVTWAFCALLELTMLLFTALWTRYDIPPPEKAEPWGYAPFFMLCWVLIPLALNSYWWGRSRRKEEDRSVEWFAKQLLMVEHCEVPDLINKMKTYHPDAWRRIENCNAS